MSDSSRHTKITLNKTDKKELVDLYREAELTPVIGFSVADMINGRDLSSLAWNRVRRKMDELGEKYGYDSQTHSIDVRTGEVVVNDLSNDTVKTEDEP